MYETPAIAFGRRYATDAHVAAYSLESVPRRLDKGAPGYVLHGVPLAIPVAYLFVDVDGPGHQATPDWRQGEEPKIARALLELPGGYGFQSRGGYKLVWRLERPVLLATPEDAPRWRLRYWQYLLGLSRRFGIHGDPSCADWTRLFRLPHTTREPGGQPEELPTLGDPSLSVALSLEPSGADLVADLEEARRLDALDLSTGGAGGPTGGPGVARPWGPAIKSLSWETGEREEGSTSWRSGSTPGAGRREAKGRPSLEERERLWVEKGLQEQALRVGRAARGTRNRAVRDAALVLGHHVPRYLSSERLEEVLFEACERNGVVREDGADASRATIRKAIRDGMATPKRPPLPPDEPSPRRSSSLKGFETPPQVTQGDQEPDRRPVVLVDFETGERIREVERHLGAREDLAVYVRDGRLVSIGMAPKRRRSLQREDGDPALVRELSVSALRGMMTDAIRFVTWRSTGQGTEKRQELVPCRPHDDLVKGLHGATGWSALRDLIGIVRAPFLADLAGSLATKPGYDEATGYYLALPGGEDLEISENPTREEALAALQRLKTELLSDFPFAGDRDRSAAIAALLTLAARPALGTANVPAFVFEANTPSSGKTLLSDVCAIVGTGAPAPKHAFTSDDREMNKTLGGLAGEARALVCFDNVIDVIGGASLDRAITCNGKLSYRLLGQNRTANSNWRAVVFFTANNPAIGGDIGRRLLVCRLESPEERPSLREGFRHPDLKGYAMGARLQLTGCALTVLRAFCRLPLAERPKCILGSFEEWAALVGGALVWLGEPSPLSAVAEDRQGVDPEQAARVQLVTNWNRLATAERSQPAWSDLHGITVKAALSALYPDGLPGVGDGLDPLREAIEGLTSAAPGTPPSTTQLAGLLRALKTRNFARFRMDSWENRQRYLLWKVGAV